MINKNLKFRNKPKFIFRVLFFTSLVLITNCDLDETQTVANFNNLVMADEFDGVNLDTNLWSYEIGNGAEQGIPGWGNNEQQYYTDRSENVRVEDGVLKITANLESFEGVPYTSGRIITKGNFQQKYGRFEARIKLPWGQGIWPAFWLLGDDNDGAEVWPQIGEIDIMEYRGQEPTITHGSVHGPGYSGGDSITKLYDIPNDRFDADFHIFGVEWGPNYINYYVDDVLYNQITPENLEDKQDADPSDWVFNDREFYIILNVAVGGSFAGDSDPTIPYPQTMEVDYVRVYSDN